MASTFPDIPPEASARLAEAAKVAVLTGAGVSAESGIPTFRGQDGLWKDYRAQDLATPGAFSRDPDLVWEWYHWRRGIVTGATPNDAHDALRIMEDRVPEFTLITQNVDGLHVRAGSRNVLELHGNLNRAKCSRCPCTMDLTGETGIVRCPDCGEPMRPDVVWFGESLDPVILETAFRSAATADLFLVAGTSSIVQPAASLAFAAKDNDGYVVEVNMDPTPLTGTADATVLGRAGEILSALVRLAWSEP